MSDGGEVTGGYRGTKVFRQFPCPFHTGLRADDQKFLATPATQHVDIADMRPDKTRHCHQDRVADLMTMGIVDLLEVIDVKNDDR